MSPYEGWLPSSPHLTQEEALRQSLLGQYMALIFPVDGLEAVNAPADAKLGAGTVIEIGYITEAALERDVHFNQPNDSRHPRDRACCRGTHEAAAELQVIELAMEGRIARGYASAAEQGHKGRIVGDERKSPPAAPDASRWT